MSLPSDLPPNTASDCAARAERLLKAGAPLVAYDTLSDGLRAWPGDVRLRQLTALALARSGAARDANRLLATLVAEGHADEETIGLLARTHKDLWAASADEGEQRHHLQLATRYYAEAYRTSGGYWSGINVATMALIAGDAVEARATARDVAAQCHARLEADEARADRYWVLATLGEAALVCHDTREAEAWYTQAAAAADRGRLADVVSTRRNARLILRATGDDGGALLDRCLPVPKVVVFAGHLIDRPDRQSPRFPSSLEAAARAAIDERVRALGNAIGYASAGCGADILFLESVDALGGETHVVLPYDAKPFRDDSVEYVPSSDWGARFERALARAAEVVVASDHKLGSGAASYEYGFRMLDGLAAMRADELDTQLVCLAAWDGRPGDGPGGTAQSVEHWQRSGRRVEIVDLARLREAAPIVVSTQAGAVSSGAGRPAAAPATPGDAFDPQIVGLLFADAHGFSRLSEAELPVFVEQYLGLVARELARLPSSPLMVNTWGDGLYAVFRDVADAGMFALQLCDAIRRTDWRACGLHRDLSLRIGLHAGPAYACLDPVTGRLNYIGAHVSRAARIEPVAPPGEVYASGAFAALARSEGVRGFSCTYVGQTPLAKGYGTFPTYVLRHRHRT